MLLNILKGKIIEINLKYIDPFVRLKKLLNVDPPWKDFQ